MSRTEWVAELAVPVSEDREHIQGHPDAAVTLVQYGDYECPYSGKAYPIVKDVQTRMGEGLRFVFRNFPISTSHPHAEQVAEAGRRSRIPRSTSFLSLAARMFRAAPVLRWSSSNRRTPRNASRSTRSVHRSPMTSRVRATEQFSFVNHVRPGSMDRP